LKKREKQRFIYRDTGWEERVPLEISVETFSTGNFNTSREEAFFENIFFPNPFSRSI
jgi:hypothetical protein